MSKLLFFYRVGRHELMEQLENKIESLFNTSLEWFIISLQWLLIKSSITFVGIKFRCKILLFRQIFTIIVASNMQYKLAKVLFLAVEGLVQDVTEMLILILKGEVSRTTNLLSLPVGTKLFWK